MNFLRSIRTFSEGASGITCSVFNSHIFVKNFCKNLEENRRSLFFNDDVQSLLKSLNRVDYERVFSPKKLEKTLAPPVIKFMTDEELEKAQKEALQKSETKLQMPPVLPPRKDIDHTFVKDKKLLNYTTSKYVFTDITYGKDDRTRQIVVRDPDGTLRKANWEERDRCNEIYFPRAGRKLRTPLMFKPGYLEDVLNKGWFLFILKRACIQFEPDDPLYVYVTEQTFDKVAETKRFLELESTRFYGSMVFYLTEQHKLAPLIVHYLNYDRLEDALCLIKLFNILHPAKACSVSVSPGKELTALKAFIEKQYANNTELELALKSYEDYYTKPKSQAVV